MKLIAIFPLILSTLLFASDLKQDKSLDSQRGMTKLLGPETYLRCSNFLADPKAKTYELSYKRTPTMLHIPH